MRVLLAIAILAGAMRPADACTPAFERAIIGAPEIEPAGAVTITNEDVVVDCDEHYACTVVSTFAIVVAQPARATVKAHHATELSLNADRARPPDYRDASTVTTELDTTHIQLLLRARVDVVPFVNGCFSPGVIARHPYLGSGRESNEHVLQIDTLVTPRVNAPSSWDLEIETSAANKYYAATKRLWFRVPARLFTHGGILAMIGASSGDGRTFRVRGGWEVAIGKPWLVFGLVGETDFGDAWNVALVAEPTTEAWVLPFSMGAGVGVVLANDSRVGGRAQLSVALSGGRMMLSLDVIDGSDGVDLGVTALIGASL